ncbi:MAG: methyltransferase domain-containing protein [Planctomycetes bacterium]|nr:methyltransferase domain-containing protein [Planctomycetota bacterium]
MSFSALRHRITSKARRVTRSISYTVFGNKISRDQWDAKEDAYDDYLVQTWDEIEKGSPDYIKRVAASIKHCTGKVLEIGCGAGNMTRWIAAQDGVAEVLGIDGFEPGIKRLNALELPNTTALVGDITKLEFPDEYKYDTLVMCEFLEHIYPDEESKLIAALKKHAAQGARYVISLPIGWLEDPHHVREFSKAKFKRHLSQNYGSADTMNYDSGYSQVASGPLSWK